MVPVTVSDKDFEELISTRAQTILGLASCVANCAQPGQLLIRPLLGQLLSQSIQIEELLDTYDARNNCRWCSFRSSIAAIKLFADVAYELLHIQHALPAYRLLPIEGDFGQATEGALGFTATILLKVCHRLLGKASELELPILQETVSEESFAERLPAGRLPHNCGTRHIESVYETVTMLATTFLHLATDSADVHAARKVSRQDHAAFAAKTITEEKLRTLELRFHNLQSMYDTYVSGTETEKTDEKLPTLRGHISVVFHLLRVATLLAHWYERHVDCPICEKKAKQGRLVTAEELLSVLMDYSLAHISQYILCAERLCHQMLKRYIEVDRLDVPVPPYRGFHVRPSTLISKLVLHYGSDIRMQINGEAYNAGSSLDLFRANELINARKRRRLAAEIDRLRLVPDKPNGTDIKDIVTQVVYTLAERSDLIIYERPLQLPEQSASREGTLLEQVTDAIARLLAIGKIDIATDVKATFTGDKRVLSDIKLLAETGYGEDSFGNNIPLPARLSYLRR
jgi:hypothetical protein